MSLKQKDNNIIDLHNLSTTPSKEILTIPLPSEEFAELKMPSRTLSEFGNISTPTNQSPKSKEL